MRLRSGFFRLSISFCLILSISAIAFADTIRLKDGSIIKGKITGFAGGSFTVAIGEGARQRNMTFGSNEIESIQFDSPQTPAVYTQPANTNQNSSPNNNVITVGQNKPADPTYSIPGAKTTPSTPNSKTPPANNKPTPSSNAIALDVQVLADNTANGWTNSGWVVKKGQRIRIVGDGRVSLGNGRYATAAGIGSLQDNDKLLKNVATGALIAVIGDDNNDFIFVGDENEFVATRDGALFLGVNEGNLEDNSGAFEVKVEIVLDGTE